MRDAYHIRKHGLYLFSTLGSLLVLAIARVKEGRHVLLQGDIEVVHVGLLGGYDLIDDVHSFLCMKGVRTQRGKEESKVERRRG